MDTGSTNSKKLLCIVGTTATGKTDIALDLAALWQSELVSCDSRQVYKGLDLGTGKEPGQKQSFSKHEKYWIINGIKIWMYDVVTPKQQYSVSDYIADAKDIVTNLWSKNKLPIIVGGTGYYLQGLLEGNETAAFPSDQQLREELERMDLSLLQEKFKNLSPDIYEHLNNSEKNNGRRLIRKIEIALSSEGEKVEGLKKQCQVLIIGLTAPKGVLDDRIEKRVIKRVKEGMIQEAVDLHAKGLSFDRMRQFGLEYGVMADFLEGHIKNENEFVLVLQQKIKQYAKRQMTWFKRDKEIVWFDITETDYQAKVEKLVQDWYNA